MITPDEIRRIANLARMDVPEEKAAMYATQLERILGYVGMLSALDTSQIEPMMHATGSDNVFRDDSPTPCLDRTAALSNAADKTDEYFRVPKTL